MSVFELPAAATYVTPTAVERQIAWCSTYLLGKPQLPSFLPLPTMLMFATRMLYAAAFAVTQSMPHRICESVPLDFEFSTFTLTIRVPGATPVTTVPLSRAARIPATFVPCPLSSFAGADVEMQFLPDTASMSGFARSTPVSSTATAGVAATCACVSEAACTRRMPGGTVSPASTGCIDAALTVTSGTTYATPGCSFTRFSCLSDSRAEKPLSAAPYACECANLPPDSR